MLHGAVHCCVLQRGAVWRRRRQWQQWHAVQLNRSWSSRSEWQQ